MKVPIVQRATMLDMVREYSAILPLAVTASGRDLLIKPDETVVLQERAVHLVVNKEVQVEDIAAVPPEPAIARLCGRRATSGFRRALEEVLPEHHQGRSLLYRLLYDVPMAVIVPAYALEFEGGADRPVRARPSGVCAGWRREGTWTRTVEADRPIPVTLGPPNLTGPREWAWPEFPPLPVGALRRLRRLGASLRGGRLVADVQFRDLFVDDGGTSRIVHEYELRAEIDPVTLSVTAIDARPGSLPSGDCGRAAAAIDGVAGKTVQTLLDHVRATLPSESTCTHLNDLLAVLVDVEVLIEQLPAAGDS